MPSPHVRPRPDRPFVIAHRGASAHAADNSLEALAMARAAGADGVEVDVRFTRDREMVLSHDDRIPGIGVISDLSLTDLRQISPSIATLDEVTGVIGDLILNIEIKNHPSDADFDPRHRQAPAVVDWLAQHGLVDRAIVSSFNPSTIEAVARREPALTTGLLLEHGGGFMAHASAAHRAPHEWLLPRTGALRIRGTRRVMQAHGLGLSIGTWTVDDPRALQKYREMGVDLVVTNDPATARAVYG